MSSQAQKSAEILAILGGVPVRATPLGYGHQSVDESDIRAVAEALRSDWLTCGPGVQAFEESIANTCKAKHAIAVNSGTAALHAAVHALGISPGDEVIVPALTFAATSNAVVYEEGTPVFADVDAETLLIDPASVADKVTDKTKAVIAVDYAGQPCDYKALRALCDARGIALIADACHSLGASFEAKPVGTLADMSTFSFHPVKPLTTGEGGMITTHSADLARRMRQFRNHGISTDVRERELKGAWGYEMTELGYNYRLSDIACTLGMSQLKRLPEFLERRTQIASLYDAAFATTEAYRPLERLADRTHAHHLYVVHLDDKKLTCDRNTFLGALRAEGILANVHYPPVHLHPYYQDNFDTRPGLCPRAEFAANWILSLPIHCEMTNEDVRSVVVGLSKVAGYYGR